MKQPCAISSLRTSKKQAPQQQSELVLAEEVVDAAALHETKRRLTSFAWAEVFLKLIADPCVAE
jgi:hypothetical protein